MCNLQKHQHILTVQSHDSSGESGQFRDKSLSKILWRRSETRDEASLSSGVSVMYLAIGNFRLILLQKPFVSGVIAVILLAHRA